MTDAALEGITVYAEGQDIRAVVEEHSMGETVMQALMTADPATGASRPIVVYGQRLTDAPDDVQVSVLIHMAHDLLLMAGSRTKGKTNDCIEQAARWSQRAGISQSEARR